MSIRFFYPDTSKVPRERVMEVLQESKNNEETGEFFVKTLFPRYLHWEEIKHLPRPSSITEEEIWAAIKFFRNTIAGKVKGVVGAAEGNFFGWIQAFPWFQEFFHQVDMQLGGNLVGMGRDMGDGSRHKFISRGVMEEAIASSQLEGVHTTRKAAKEFLREQRKPRTRDEQMLLNNYRTMQFIESEFKNEELTKEALLRLHNMITEKTLENESEVGRFRKTEDNIQIQNSITGEVAFIPPNTSFIQKELDRLISYANDRLNDLEFVHPVVKAIILHFWIGYLHPFVDGNGRIARALFYWYLLRKGYWAFAYLPLSRAIKDSPAQYANAFLYAEHDDNDLTYFIDYNIRKIQQAKNEFEIYLKEKREESTKVSKLAKSDYGLNERQIQLLLYCRKNSNASTSAKTHMNVNRISRITAMKDLKQLEVLGFLQSKKNGREIHYFGTDKVEKLI